eukprot:jgi/Hompol1/3264/HPOL_006436-RA
MPATVQDIIEINQEDEGDKGQFTIKLKGCQGLAHAKWKEVDASTIDIVSTFVPPEARGGDIGEKLVRLVYDLGKQKGVKVVGSCWYADLVLGALN